MAEIMYPRRDEFGYMRQVVLIGLKILNGTLALALCGVVMELYGVLGGMSSEQAARTVVSFVCGLAMLVVVSWILIDGRLMRWVLRECRMCSGFMRNCLMWIRRPENAKRLLAGAAIALFGWGIFAHYAELFVNCVGRWMLISVGLTSPVWSWVHWLVRTLLGLAWIMLCRKYLAHVVALLVERPEVDLVVSDDDLDIVDAPLGEHNADRLHRDVYVGSLLDMIDSMPRNAGAQYFGIYGEWGDGKSSVLGLLRSRARDRNLIVATYDAWRLTKDGDLSMALFSVIADAVQNERDNESRFFRDFGKALSLAGRRGFIESIPCIGEPIGRILRGTLDVTTVKDRLVAALSQSGRRIVVALDDLDRLAPDEVYQLLRMIKANGDLPGLTYFVMADKAYLARCLDQVIGGKDDNMAGKRYLEKIVTQEFPLPFVQPSEFYAKFISDLGRLRGEYPEFKRFAPVDGSLRVSFHYLQNLRSEKRLIACIRGELSFQRQKAFRNGQKYPSICFEDLVELVAIKLFREDVYYALFENRSKIWQTAEKTRQGEWSKPLTESFVDETLLRNAQGDECAVLREFLEKRMGMHFNSDGCRYVKPGSAELCNCRLMQRECFEGYFCSLDHRIASAVTKDLLGSVGDALPDGSKVADIFMKAHNEEALPNLLATLRFSDVVRDGDLVSCQALLKAFAQISCQQFFSQKKRPYGYRVRPYVGDGIYVNILQAFKAVAMICMPKEHERTKFILTLLRELDHFTLPALLYMDEIRARDGHEPHFFSEAGLNMLRAHILNCGRMFGGRLMDDYPDEIIVRRAWIDAAARDKDADEARFLYKMMSESVERYPDVVHALWPFLWVDKEDWMVTIDYDKAMRYADPTVAEATLKQQVGRSFSKMLPHEVCLLEALRYCKENRKKGHDCGRINQCNHLRFLAIEVPTSDLGRKLAFRKGELV